MLFNIILMSKNKFSLLKLCTYFNKKIVKTTLLNSYLISQKNCLNKKVKITVLKSPHVNKKAKEIITKYYLDLLNIGSHTMARQLSHLSAGNKQKVLLAKWFFSNSKVFIFDKLRLI